MTDGITPDHAMPMVEMVNNETGESFSLADMERQASGLDLAAIAAEMKRRVNLLILPGSLFYPGSEFRAFVKDFTDLHGAAPEFFSIGDTEMPIPSRWPEDAYFSVVPRNWYGDWEKERLPNEVGTDMKSV
jgi:hypothetical protein